MRPLLPVLAALMILLGPRASLAQEAVTAKFVGRWVGNGVVRPGGFDPQEAIRCKVTGVQDTANQTSFAGRCATPGGAGEFRVTIAQAAAGTKLAARVRLGNRHDAVDFSGIAAAGKITLRQREPLRRGKRLLRSTIVFDFARDGSLTMTDRVTDMLSQAQATALKVRFERRQ